MPSKLDLKAVASGQPTEVLALRVEAWRKVVRSFWLYLQDYATLQEDLARQHSRITNGLHFPGLPAYSAAAVESITPEVSASGFSPDTGAMFLPVGSDSIADVPRVLSTFHTTQAAHAATASKKLKGGVIPRLESVETDLISKISEIRTLAPDFNNTVVQEQEATFRATFAYSMALEAATNQPGSLAPKNDPCLLKPALDRQVAKQLKEENYLIEAHVNILSSGKELENVIVSEIQLALKEFGAIAGLEAEPLQDLSIQILSGFPNQDPLNEWDYFLSNESTFLPADSEQINSKEAYAGQNSNLANAIRSGYLERRSKYLKSYSKAWYVLTPCFLHEFKSPRDLLPVLSLPLSDCQVSHDKKNSGSISHRFVISVHQPGSLAGKGQNWVFRAENNESLNGWFNDLTAASQHGDPISRANKFFPQKVVEPEEQEKQEEEPVAEQELEKREKSAALGTAGTAGTAAVPVAAAAVPIAAVTVPAVFSGTSDSPTSPTFSVSSGVTSLGEPFNASSETEDLAPVVEEEGRRPEPPGRFPSNVAALSVSVAVAAGQAAMVSPALLPSEVRGAEELEDNEDTSSVFSYDLKKETHSTLPDDKHFLPVNADTPVAVERRLTMTNHKEEQNVDAGIGVARGPDEPAHEDQRTALMRRRSSVASTKSGQRGNSTLVRKPTGSFGMEELKPLTTSDQPPALFFAGGLPETTSSGTSTAA